MYYLIHGFDTVEFHSCNQNKELLNYIGEQLIAGTSAMYEVCTLEEAINWFAGEGYLPDDNSPQELIDGVKEELAYDQLQSII